MILRSPSFEKKMRERMRALCKASPELRKERSKVSRLAARTRAPGLSRAIGLAVCLMLLAILAWDGGTEACIAAVSLWAIGSAFKLAAACLGMFYGSVDLFVLHHLPLSHAQIFRVQGRKFGIHASWALVDFALAYAVITLISTVSVPAFLAAVGIGLFQGALAIALGIHLASRFPQLPLNAIGSLLRSAPFFFLFFGKSFFAQMAGLGTLIDLTNPSGWVNYVFRQTSLAGEWWMLTLLAPLSMIIWAAKLSWRKLQIAYSALDEMELELQKEQAEMDEFQPPAENLPRRKGVTEITDEIHSGEFRTGANWFAGGWIEKLMANVWTKRENALADVLLCGLPKWSRTYHRTAVALAICALFLAVFRDNGQFILFIAGYFLITSTYSIFSREWRGLETLRAPGGFIPFYAFFPINYLALVKVLWKANFIRWVVSAPFYIAFGLFGGWIMGGKTEAGLDLALKIYFLLLAVQPFVLFCALSAGTNDISKGTFGSVVLALFLFVPVFIGMVTLIIRLFISTDRASAAICIGSVFLISLFLLGLQWLGNRRGYFDLVSSHSSKQDK